MRKSVHDLLLGLALLCAAAVQLLAWPRLRCLGEGQSQLPVFTPVLLGIAGGCLVAGMLCNLYLWRAQLGPNWITERKPAFKQAQARYSPWAQRLLGGYVVLVMLVTLYLRTRSAARQCYPDGMTSAPAALLFGAIIALVAVATAQTAPHQVRWAGPRTL